MHSVWDQWPVTVGGERHYVPDPCMVQMEEYLDVSELRRADNGLPKSVTATLCLPGPLHWSSGFSCISIFVSARYAVHIPANDPLTSGADVGRSSMFDQSQGWPVLSMDDYGGANVPLRIGAHGRY